MKLFLLVLILLLSFTLVGCDHTDLNGEISVYELSENSFILELLVPEELNDIHDVMWTCGTDNCVLITEDIETILDLNGYDYSVDTLDRYAYVEIKGDCTIEVDGFYKQTNPQPITDINLPIDK